MLTFRKVVQKADTALRSFDETPDSRVPGDHASAHSRVVTLARIDHVG
jgi:hypothetical protein